jgi:hypothetical protein
MPLAVIYIAAGILLLGAAQLHLAYGFYTLLRIVATGTFLWAFLVSFKRNASLLPWIFLSFAIVFNPIIKVTLPGEFWMFLDIAASALLLLTQNKIKQESSRKLI